MVVPSFKNRKIICGKRLVTARKQKRLMRLIEAAFAYQLSCASRTAADETWTESFRRSWIASSTPGDDCWTQVAEVEVRGEICCAPGDEGATVTITRL